MTFISNGKVHTHIKEVSEGHKVFCRGKKTSRLQRAHLYEFTKAGIEHQVISTQTGRNVGSCLGSSGSKRFWVSIPVACYEQARAIVTNMDKAQYKSMMQANAYARNASMSAVLAYEQRLTYGY